MSGTLNTSPTFILLGSDKLFHVANWSTNNLSLDPYNTLTIQSNTSPDLTVYVLSS
jgi:hypothetical protein